MKLDLIFLQRRTIDHASNGQRPLRQVRGSKGANLNLVRTIFPDVDIVRFKLQNGSMTTENPGCFSNILEISLGEGEAYIIMDDASVHNCVQMEQGNHEVKNCHPTFRSSIQLKKKLSVL